MPASPPPGTPFTGSGIATPLPWRDDPLSWFEPIHDQPGTLWLDSGAGGPSGGRFDLGLFAPRKILTSRPGEPRANFLDALRCVAGGDGAHLAAAGFAGYDFGRESLGIPSRLPTTTKLPEAWAGLYDAALVIDHDSRQAWLVHAPDTDPRPFREMLGTRPAAAVARPFRLGGEFRGDTGYEAYAGAFARIQQYIRDGDCYQVNLAQRFRAPYSGDTWEAWRRVRNRYPAAYGAYLRIAGGALLCHSPEQFLEVRGREVTTRPIKGTRPRDDDPARDRALAEALAASVKDQAENLMIVDLLRNDIGRFCDYGSVRVPRLYQLESHATVHHLVSTVSGRLHPESTPLDLLAGCLPGGSVTGAPKHRAVQIIDELEPCRRHAYCGSVFWIDRDGNLDSNIAIRTLVADARELQCWGGGGIVADSDCEEEYKESIVKVRRLLDVLEETLP